MKKVLGIMLAALLCVMMAVAASAADIYVNDGGVGDGSSADAPMGSMTDAIQKIAATGGTVHIVDTYTCAEEYYEPAHDGDIVISGGKYIFTNGQYNRWFLAGAGSTTFENITFEYGAGSTSLFIAQFNELIFGEGLQFPDGGKCYVIGGYQNPFTDAISLDKDSHITIKSGNLWCVAGFNRGAGELEFTGTSHITIDGGEIETVYGANVNGNFANSAEIIVNGGMIANLRLGGDATRRINGNAVATVNGGTVGLLSVNNVMGAATVNYNGGMIAGAEKTVSENLVAFVTDGTATLNASPNVEARMLALSFDAVNYVGGGVTPVVTTTAAPVVTEPVATTAAPAETTAASVETTIAPETSIAPETTAVPETTAAPETTVAPETTEDAAETTAAPETTAALVPAEEGSAPVGMIIAIVAAVVVIATIVLVVLKKKKN